jgi:Flp pilus assembly protein TadD
MNVKATELRKGMVLLKDGDLVLITDYSHHTPGNWRSIIQVNLGKTYRDLGVLEQAQTAFRRAVVLDPTSAAAHNDLGNVAYRLGDCPTAEYELSEPEKVLSEKVTEYVREDMNRADRNAQAVGEATTTAVVKSLVWIVVAASATTVLFQSLGL